MRPSAIHLKILFSSVASLLGSPGQSNYSAANAMLESLAFQSQNQGLQCSAVQWGAWSGSGMGVQDHSTEMRLARTGISMITPDHGLSLLSQIIVSSGIQSTIAAIPFDWKMIQSQYPVPAFFSEMVGKQHSVQVLGDSSQRNTSLEISDVQKEVAYLVKSVVGPEIGGDDPLMASGLDSLGAVELRNNLQTTFGIKLPTTIVFDYPTIFALSEFIVEQFSVKLTAAGVQEIVSDSLACSSHSRSLPLAVSSITQRSPDDALSFTGNDQDTVRTAPLERWDIELEPLAARFIAYLKNIEMFDASAFGISSTEATLMDPQQRILLEVVSETSLTHPSDDIPPSRRGLYVGVASSDYVSLLSKHTEKGAFHATSSATSVVCGRVSYALSFRGPSMSIDTACSASLVAMHLGGRAVQNLETPLSIAAGVHIQCAQLSSLYVSSAGMLSPQGRCKTLDASADGYVRGESCTALSVSAITESVGDSEEDNRVPSPLLILAGSAVNQDGRSSSLTAPNGPAQQELLISAMAEGNLCSDQIRAISMHGTGTPLGDPIEIGAAFVVLEKTPRIEKDGKGNRLPVNFIASKSWVGHGEPAAGLAGILFAKAAMVGHQTLQLPHLRNLNPFVADAVKGHAFKVHFPRQAGELLIQQGCVGTSAFAFQGTNAHVLLSHAKVVGDYPGTRWSHASTIWQHGQYYVAPLALEITAKAIVPSFGTVGFEANLVSVSNKHLWDHRVMDKVVFPGSGYFGMYQGAVLNLLSYNLLQQSGLCDAFIPSPLILPTLSPSKGIIIRLTIDRANGAVKVTSKSSSVHFSGFISLLRLPMVRESPHAASCSSHWMQNGSKFFNLESCKPPALCNLRLENGMESLDPATLDSALQLGQTCNKNGSDDIFVPAGVEAILMPSTCAGNSITNFEAGWATAAAAFQSRNEAVTSYGIFNTGQLPAVCNIYRLLAKPFRRHTDRVYSFQGSHDKNLGNLYETSWQVDSSASSDPCLGFGDGIHHIPLQETKYMPPAVATGRIIEALQRIFRSGDPPKAVQAHTMGLVPSFVYPTQVPGCMNDAALYAGIRTMSSEIPQIKWSAVDHDVSRPGPPSLSSSQVMTASSEAAVDRVDAFGVVLHASTRSHPLLLQSASKEMPQPFHLVPAPRGSLANIVPKPVLLTTGDNGLPGQVSVSIKAIGINFRDVLNILGMYPGDPGDPGGDFSGILTGGTIKDGARTVAEPGDPVFGLAQGCLGSHVMTSSKLVAPITTSLTYEEAATLPTVFVTVDVALGCLSSIKHGSRVLVHAAAGGVGLAAMQMASEANATVIATAGSPFKRSVLRNLGIDIVLGSRDLQFAEELFAACHGEEGIDVLLNTLTSPGFVSSSLSVLRLGGQLVEISKRDIWSVSRVLQERPDVIYNLLAVDFMSGSAIHASLMRISQRIARGTLRPLPQVVHSLTNVASAFRQISQARHVGKIVLNLPEIPRQRLKMQSRVIISGGTGSLGSLAAAWMLRNGSQYLHLLARTGKCDRACAEKLLADNTALITLSTCNVAMSEDVINVLTNEATTPFLRLLLASGRLADATLQNQSFKGIKEVFSPKVSSFMTFQKWLYYYPGLPNILFSSLAALVGSPGQLNYSMANAVLDNFAINEQSRGINTLSIQFGAWKTSGMAEITSKKAESLGFGALSPELGLASLHRIMIMTACTPSICITPINWEILLRKQRNQSRFFAEFTIENVQESSMEQKKIGHVWEQHSMKQNYIKEQVYNAAVAIIGGETGEEMPLMAAGLDSLGAVELRNSLEQLIGIDLPSTLIFDYPTIGAIAAFISNKVTPQTSLMPSASVPNTEGVVMQGSLSLPISITDTSIRVSGDALYRMDPDDMSTRTPLIRWNVDEDSQSFQNGDLAVQFGVYLKNIAEFDAQVFGISSTEAAFMDPQQRLVLESVAELVNRVPLSELIESILSQWGVFVVS